MLDRFVHLHKGIASLDDSWLNPSQGLERNGLAAQMKRCFIFV
jgi:hypothetical protein